MNSPTVEESAKPAQAAVHDAAAVNGYDRVFWLGYLSNGLTTLANGMMVRYSDLVTSLGGDEQQLGLIVGCGMVGSIAIRLFQGDAVDRYGAGRIWRWSLTIYSISLLLHLLLSTAYGPGIFFVRILMQASLAGVFGSSITFVSLRVRPQKMAEIIGTLGTSGFMGLMAGPLISDWLASLNPDPHQMVQRILCMAAAFAVVSVGATWFATQGAFVPPSHERPALWKVVSQYHPLLISMTAAAMGAGFAIPMTFLRPFAVEKGFGSVGMFFAVYAFTGLVARVASRSVFERFGNRPWIVLGLVLLTASYSSYIIVATPQQLIVPAVIAGIAHALLFPSVMAEGTSAFPRKYLGIATSLTLAMFDVGTFLSAPLVGIFLREARGWTANVYGWMFMAVAFTFAVVTVVYAFSQPVKKERS